MKRSEIAYLITTLVYATLWSFVAAFWIYRLFVGDNGMFDRFIAIVNVAIVAAISAPSILALRLRHLSLGGSIVQFVFLIVTVYGAPIAIWGIVLLRRSLLSQTIANKVSDATSEPAPSVGSSSHQD